LTKRVAQTEGVHKADRSVEEKRVPALVGGENQGIQGVADQKRIRHPTDIFKSLLWALYIEQRLDHFCAFKEK